MTLNKYEKKRILVTVKTYPNPNPEFGETVCCAGIDLETNQLIRLYPITFRYLDENKKFRKYSIIEAECCRSKEDTRPESHHVNCDSIEVKKVLDPENGTWKSRKEIVLKAPIKTMCQIREEAATSNISLGIIKPENISFDYTKRLASDPMAREACYTQLSFLNKQINKIEYIPFQFYYKFKCAGFDQCPGHDLPIVDWEIGQAYRDWRSKYTDETILLEKITEKWLDIADTEKRDVHFYVGNLKCNKKLLWY
ncbi:MAG: hypothetical protein GX409_03880 [candidate division Zixibacteria bacterium]|jgi:hypothetical protein|nr:hypothetical protein [candidate division Zixibacteria bacterium]